MPPQLFLIVFIIAPTSIISLLAFKNIELFDKLKFNASHIFHSKEYSRFFSHGFVHADSMHLFINMFVLWSFGNYVLVEYHYFYRDLSNLFFIGLYFPALAFSSLSSFIKHRDNVYYNAVGASGAVSAVVFASIILNPGGEMRLFLVPFPLPSWLFGLLYLVFSAYMSKKEMDNIGHDAHFWGALYGMFYVFITIHDSLINFITYFFH